MTATAPAPVPAPAPARAAARRGGSTPLLLARRQLLQAPGRVAAVLVAALLSALAVMTTGTFIGTMQQGMRVVLSAPTSNADIAVQFGAEPLAADELLAFDGVAVAEPLVSSGGEVAFVGEERSVDLHGIAVDPALRWVELREGAWPSGRDEVALSQRDLDGLGAALGDELELAPWAEAPLAVRVVGVVAPPAGAEGALAAVHVDAAAWEGSAPGALVRLEPGADAEAVLAAMRAEFGDGPDAPQAMSAERFVDDLVDRFTGGANVLATVFLAFIAIALIAATMVIRNTFQVLLAQRLRENGLLRLVGASGGQVQRSVLVEALLVGATGALAGTAAGFGLGWLIAAAFVLAAGGPRVDAAWPIAAIAVTVAVTLLAAWAPAASTRSLSPVAALSASATTERRTRRSSTAGWIIGAIVTAIGAAGLVAAALLHNLLIAIGAGVIAAIGLIVLVPLLVRALTPLVARLLTLGGPVPKLAGENLVRTARRSGTVVLAIALGGSLAIAMLTAVESVTATMTRSLDDRFRVDAVVATVDGAPLTDAQLAAIAALPSVDGSAAVRTLAVESSAPELGVDRAAELPGAWADRADRAGAGAALLPTALVGDEGVVPDGSPFELRVPGGEAVALAAHGDRVANTSRSGPAEAGPSVVAVLSPTDFAALGGAPEVTEVWLDAAAGGASALSTALDELADTDRALVYGGPVVERSLYEEIAGFLTAFVLAMLALTIVISAIGLASVVALSVAERRRELALLRALGAERRDARLMVVLESVSLALLGAVLSIAIGVPLGIAAVESAVVEAAGGTVLAVPWTAVGLVLGAAVLLGVLAGLGPAHRAARITPAAALSRE
ncbi:MAG: ABC transporter permease [Microbacteriaceae bacterium]|nr:ABC transporter permease [Microbacteriaceae bacterium]